MFAGAVREAVFSRLEVIAQIKKDYIPVALKAGTMGNPPPGVEGQIYRELLRTRAAPQGICVMNSAGKALAWTLGFDDDASVAGFFDHAKSKYDASPNAGVATERYRRFPSIRADDVPDNGVALELPGSHAADDHCPGDLRRSKGSIPGRIVGRAFGKDRKPLSDARSQDNYVEDILEITRGMQDQLLAAAAKHADGRRFEIPAALSRAFAENAYLGMLDVNPLGGDRVRAKATEETIRLWGELQGDGRVLISGRSTVRARNREDVPRDAGRKWSHFVDLRWSGFADIDEVGIREIVVSARGHEELKWGGPGSHVSPEAVRNPVAYLLGGRPLDIASPVRYGITAKR